MSSSARQEGRIAVVTGAAVGIGRAYAQRIAADGAHVVLADIADLRETTKLIADERGRVSSVHCDVSDPLSVNQLRTAVAELGGADILVHNAGIYPMVRFEQITFEGWRRVMAVNLDSMFLLTQAFLLGMRERKWGRIIGISSGMFHGGAPGALHYVASKGGIVGFVRSLATEVGADGITVNAIAPGLVRSHGTSTGVHDQLGLFSRIQDGQAIKRVGLPEDLTGMLSFLISDEASWMTGQTLLVDGGQGRS